MYFAPLLRVWSSSLGVVPSLFALCIAHWFTSLSTLARCDKPGLNMVLRIFILHCYPVWPLFSVLRWWIQKGRNCSVRRLSIFTMYKIKIYISIWVHSKLAKHTCLSVCCIYLSSLSNSLLLSSPLLSLLSPLSSPLSSLLTTLSSPLSSLLTTLSSPLLSSPLLSFPFLSFPFLSFPFLSFPFLSCLPFVYMATVTTVSPCQTLQLAWRHHSVMWHLCL